MIQPILPFRLLLLIAVVLGLAVGPSAAQTQFASQVATKAGVVNDDVKAADSDIATYAVIKPSVVLGYTSLRLHFTAPTAVGKPAGLYIKPNVPVGLALLDGATINTYVKDGTRPVESYALSSNLVTLNLLPSGATEVIFKPTRVFTDVELVVASTLAASQDIAFYEAYSTVSPLPVVLTAFQGQATPAGVALSWQTASELNSDYFVVERAADPAQGFEALRRVASQGTSSQPQRYQFVDATPLSLGYYRLRQVDRDGTTTYGPVVAVAARPSVAGLAAYPTLAAAALTVAGATPGTPLDIIDQMGRAVQRVAAPGAQSALDVRHLPAGNYVVRDATTGQRARFVKAADF